MNVVIDLVDGFVTWQTPVTFLAGVGSYHLWVQYRQNGEAKSEYRE